LSAIYRIQVPSGDHRLATAAQLEPEKRPADRAFYAVVTNEWVAGLAPIFAVEKTNRMELRRRPPRGQENFSEPLFFALPLEDEPDAVKLVGRWNCRATREGSKPYLGFDLGLDGNHVFGRFDQNTDYRFAFIPVGSFRSNWLELRVEYINDIYLLTGLWRDGILKGQWRRSDDSENGTWEASRAHTPILAMNDTVALYEWRRAIDGALYYAVGGERMDATWQRAPRPLCRVWARRSD
jgi:hypothetical protein